MHTSQARRFVIEWLRLKGAQIHDPTETTGSVMVHYKRRRAHLHITSELLHRVIVCTDSQRQELMRVILDSIERASGWP